MRAEFAEVGRVSPTGHPACGETRAVDVECRAAGAAASEVSVCCTLTGLSHEGEAFVGHFLDEAAYAAFIDEWRNSLAAALVSPPR